MSRTFSSHQKNRSICSQRLALILLLCVASLGHDSARGGHADRSWDSGANPAANIGDWSDPLNWTLNQVPVAIDVVSIGQLPIAENNWVNLDTIQSVADLEITNGMTLDTNGFPLAVGDAIEIDGRNEVLVPAGPIIYSSRLIVDNGIFLDDVVANRIFVSNGAQLELRNGSRVRIDSYLSVGSSHGGLRAAVRGTGAIDFNRDTLDPDGPFPFRAASFGGNLWVDDEITLNQNGSARIDLDGIENTGSISLGGIGVVPEVLNVNGDALYDVFDGEILIADNNRLNMNLTNGWELGENGQITLIGTDGTLAVIEGSDLDFHGMLRNYDGQIDADVVFQNTAQIEFRGTSILRLEGATTFSGANFYEFDGASVPHIIQNGNLTIDQNTTLAIPSGIFNWDGQGGNTITTIEPGATFTINANAIDTFAGFTGGRYDGETNVGNGGELVVNTSAAWFNDGVIRLEQATLEGSGVLNTGLIQGNGKVSPARLDNQGTLRSFGGGLLAIGPDQGETGGLLSFLPVDGIDALENGVLNYAFDLDGADEDGVLLAVDGDLRVDAFQGNFVFDGTLNIGFGYKYLMNTGGLYNRGTLTITGGGEYRADLVQDGQLIVSLGVLDDAVIVSDNANFSSTGTNTLLADLYLQGNVVVQEGAQFDGDSSLINMSGSVLTAENGSFFDVTVENLGRLDLDIISAKVGVLVFENYDTGTLVIDLASNGGVAGFDLDQLVVAGLADLAGTLEVNLLDGFMPTAGDAFTILTATGGVSGTFGAYDFPALIAGDEWSVRYEFDRVILTVSAVAIPEPSTLLLAAFAALGLLPRSRSKAVQR